MSIIVAGRFDTTLQVQAVLKDLARSHFARDEVAGYYVNPPGHYGLVPLGAVGDVKTGPAEAGAAGLALGGMASAMAPEAAAAAVPAAQGVGSYMDTLLGTYGRRDAAKAREAASEHAEAGTGPMVAICVDRPGTEQIARAALHEHGAHIIERMEGRWENGDWKDFDPSASSPALEGQH